MNTEKDLITVCVCTFRRPGLLQKLLHALERQTTGDSFAYSIVIADNDVHESAKAVVSAFTQHSLLSIVYCVEPRQNIALARNLAIKYAKGNYIAMVDDDEIPKQDWLFIRK